MYNITFVGHDYDLHTDRMNNHSYERNDCTVFAVADYLDIPYSTSHALLKRHGRKDSHATTNDITVRSVEFATHSEHMAICYGDSLKTFIAEVAEYLDNNDIKCLITFRNHIASYKDRTLSDDMCCHYQMNRRKVRQIIISLDDYLQHEQFFVKYQKYFHFNKNGVSVYTSAYYSKSYSEMVDLYKDELTAKGYYK